MQYQLQLVAQETLYRGFLRLDRYRLRHSLYAGGWSNELIRERVESFRASSVLPYDPVRDEVVLIEQFRIGALEEGRGAWVLEVVGGIIDAGETPEGVAQREAMEEAGCPLLELEKICEFMVAPGTSTERIHLFCARVDAGQAVGIHGVHHEGEDIRVEVLGFAAAMAELYGGRINSTSTIVAMQWLALNRDSLRARWLGSTQP